MFGFDILQPTPLDLRWRMFGIAVRVHPLFWLVAILIGPHRPWEGVIWVLAFFVSVLIHELGHAVLAKAFGWDPWVVLYGLGGLTFFQPQSRAVGARVGVAFAGPLAGFLLAAAVWALVLGHEGVADFEWADLLSGPVNPDWPESEFARQLLFYLGFINFWLNVLNLLPVYPLDGGQISRLLLSWRWPRQGARWSAYLSIAVAAAVAIWGLVYEQIFLAVLFGLMAVQEINSLQGPKWGYYERRP